MKNASDENDGNPSATINYPSTTKAETTMKKRKKRTVMNLIRNQDNNTPYKDESEQFLDNKNNNSGMSYNNNKAVQGLRLAMAAVLISAAVIVSTAVFLCISGLERKEFNVQFQSDANKLLADIGDNFALTMSAADAFMFRVVSQAHLANATWPMVPPSSYLAVNSAKLLSQTDSIYMALYPLIGKEDRQKWENFTKHNDGWVEDALTTQAANPNFKGPIVTNYSNSYSIWNNEGPEPEDAPGPFLPSWLGSPVIPLHYYPFNWNALAYDAFAKGLLYCMETKSVVVTAVANHADPTDPIAYAQAKTTSHWAIPYLDENENPEEPFSDMYYPVIDSLEHVFIDTTQQNVSAIGVVAFSFYWRHTLKDILPDQSQGLHIVFQNPCGNQYFTYQVDGKTPTFLGFGDLHQSQFDSLAKSSSLADLTNRDGSYTGVPMNADFCSYTITVYPSTSMKEKFRTTTPIVFSLGAAFIFIFVAALFFFYDCLVHREFDARQQLLEAKRHFMRFVSHEVRTPLNAVCLGLSILQDEMNQAGSASNNQHNNICCCENHNSSRSNNNNNINNKDSNEHSVTSLCGSETSNNPSESSQQRQQQLADLECWLHLIREICDSAESSVDVLDDLLNYDKIQMGSFSMEFTIFSVSRLVEETSREFKLSARKKNVEFTLDNQLLYCNHDVNMSSRFDLEEADGGSNSLMIVGDRIRLAQVLRNLVSNSLKFTAEKGHLTIRTSYEPIEKHERLKLDRYKLKSGEDVAFKRKGTVLIEVIDTGVGMSETQLKLLFQDGAQFNVNELQAGKGSGLGLFISKGMVTQHRGELKAFSAGLGHGSTFTLKLPLYHTAKTKEPPNVTYEASSTPAQPSQQQASSSTSSTEKSQQSPLPTPLGVLQSLQVNDRNSNFPSNKSSLRILVVDDVTTNRKLVSRMARNRSHIVDEAQDGREAVDKVKNAMAKNVFYDTILMDYEMPVMKGPDAVLEIRQMGCTSFIVGVTGNVLEEDVAHFTSCGANFVLAKPVKFQKLEEMWFENGIIGDELPS